MVEARVAPEGYLWTKDAISQLLDADHRYRALYQRLVHARLVIAPDKERKWAEEKPKRAFRLVDLLTRRQTRIVDGFERSLTIYAFKPKHDIYPLPAALGSGIALLGRLDHHHRPRIDSSLDRDADSHSLHGEWAFSAIDSRHLAVLILCA